MGHGSVYQVYCWSVDQNISEQYIIQFSQNQKGFGCIGAAVLLTLFPKEVI